MKPSEISLKPVFLFIVARTMAEDLTRVDGHLLNIIMVIRFFFKVFSRPVLIHVFIVHVNLL